MNVHDGCMTDNHTYLRWSDWWTYMTVAWQMIKLI